MYCASCGTQTPATAAFCHACGKPIANCPAESAPQLTQPELANRGLRMLNWAIIALLVPGAAMVLLRTPQANSVLFALLFFALVLGPFLLAAVVLSPSITSFAGFPVLAYRERLRKIGVVANLIVALLGAAGLVACLLTSQFAPMFGMLVYVVPSALNFKALRRAGKSMK